MFSALPATFQRRPALIPADVHLSSEDERSVLLRVGNLRLTSLETRVSSSKDNSQPTLASSRAATQKRPLVDVAVLPEFTASKQGSKRKASTTAEQYQEFISTVNKTLLSESSEQDHHVTEDNGTLHTTMSNNIGETKHISTGDIAYREFEGQSISPKNRTRSDLHNTCL